MRYILSMIIDNLKIWLVSNKLAYFFRSNLEDLLSFVYLDFVCIEKVCAELPILLHYHGNK